MPVSKEQAKKNIGRLTGLKGAALDRAAAKFVRKQKRGTKKKRKK